MKRLLIIGAAAVAMCGAAWADAVKVGIHETGNVHVDSGTVMQNDSVVLGDKAKFYKTGAGELVLPLANVNRQRDYSLTALDGKMTHYGLCRFAWADVRRTRT